MTQSIVEQYKEARAKSPNPETYDYYTDKINGVELMQKTLGLMNNFLKSPGLIVLDKAVSSAESTEFTPIEKATSHSDAKSSDKSDFDFGSDNKHESDSDTESDEHELMFEMDGFES